MPYIFLWPTRLMACFISCARAFQFSHFYTFDLRALCCVLLSLSPNPTTISAARMILETQLYRELARVIQSLISAMCTCIRRRAHLRASSRPSPLLVRHLKWGPRMTSGPLEANSPSPHDLSLGRIRVTTRIRETASAQRYDMCTSFTSPPLRSLPTGTNPHLSSVPFRALSSPMKRRTVVQNLGRG